MSVAKIGPTKMALVVQSDLKMGRGESWLSLSLSFFFFFFFFLCDGRVMALSFSCYFLFFFSLSK